MINAGVYAVAGISWLEPSKVLWMKECGERHVNSSCMSIVKTENGYVYQGSGQRQKENLSQSYPLQAQNQIAV